MKCAWSGSTYMDGMYVHTELLYKSRSEMATIVVPRRVANDLQLSIPV